MTLYARLLAHTIRENGTTDTYYSMALECRAKPVIESMGSLRRPRKRRPMPFEVKLNGRWRRVFSRTSAMTAPYFLGHWRETGEQLRIDHLPF